MTVLALAINSGDPRTSVAPHDEQECIRLAAQGDSNAFGELVRLHERTVYNLCLRFMRDPHAAEDMAQDAFLKAFRRIRTFRGRSAFSTWLYRLTVNTCLDELAKRKRRRAYTLEEAPIPAEMPAPERSETAAIIRACVAKLPERDAMLITLYYLEEESYERIAAKLELPMGTLKTWLHRARKRLRTIVEKELQA
jgi:RNA polymerase sigma-70 factor (ECF subfamily)